MVKLSNIDRARALGHLQAGMPQNQVAVMFNVSISTVKRLQRRYRDTGDVKDRPRSGRPRVTDPRDDRYIRLAALRNRTITARELQGRMRGRGLNMSYQTIRNRLHSQRLKARKPARKPLMTARHRQERLRWCRNHRAWNLRQYIFGTFFIDPHHVQGSISQRDMD